MVYSGLSGGRDLVKFVPIDAGEEWVGLQWTKKGYEEGMIQVHLS